MPDEPDLIGHTTERTTEEVDPLYNRVRILYLDVSLLLQALQGEFALGLSGLPEHYQIRNCGYDYTRRAIFAHIHSAEYDESPSGMIPPTIEATYALRYRAEVSWFAGEMEKKLAKHDHDRDGWLGVPATGLFRLMGEHEAKLLGSVVEGDPDKIISAAADVANYCLMIADNALWDQTIREAVEGHPDGEDSDIPTGNR